MSELVTETIGDEDQPHVTICPGKVDAETFAQAHIAEGWSGDDIDEDCLKQEYWIKVGDHHWKRSDQNNPKSELVTVMEW